MTSTAGRGRDSGSRLDVLCAGVEKALHALPARRKESPALASLSQAEVVVDEGLESGRVQLALYLAYHGAVGVDQVGNR